MRQFLLPMSMLDWVPPDHLVWFVIECAGPTRRSG